MSLSTGNRIVRVAATQINCVLDRKQNVENAVAIVREAAAQGANIILLQELFESVYFCQEIKSYYFEWAVEEHESELLHTFSELAKELKVVLPVSFFEKSNNVYYNSIVVFDIDGRSLGKYRKSHIPDGTGYLEKYYFSPGDTGFKVFHSTYGKIGVGICWDQWFPETARSLVLQGAEILFFPTAIGSEPNNAAYDSAGHWQRAMVGHSASNMVPVVASNRVGTETFDRSEITFYGTSFITDYTGAILQQADRVTPGVLVAELNLTQCAAERAAWGLFRDRRPELYGPLLTKDGRIRPN